MNMVEILGDRMVGSVGDLFSNRFYRSQYSIAEEVPVKEVDGLFICCVSCSNHLSDLYLPGIDANPSLHH